MPRNTIFHQVPRYCTHCQAELNSVHTLPSFTVCHNVLIFFTSLCTLEASALSVAPPPVVIRYSQLSTSASLLFHSLTDLSWGQNSHTIGAHRQHPQLKLSLFIHESPLHTPLTFTSSFSVTHPHYQVIPESIIKHRTHATLFFRTLSSARLVATINRRRYADIP